MKHRVFSVSGEEPGEFGSSSWPGDSYLHGGGLTWMPGTYDPRLNALYWTTSNAAPDFVGDSHRKTIAIGLNQKMTDSSVLFRIQKHGSLGGIVEKLNWATGLDAAGRPILSGRIPAAQGTNICPGIDGATNWFSPSYNPDTGLFYVMALESCNLFLAKPKEFVKGETFYNTGTTLPRGERMQKILLALFVADGKRAWSYKQIGQGSYWGGTLTTAGRLAFFGDDSNSFEAVEAKTDGPTFHKPDANVYQIRNADEVS